MEKASYGIHWFRRDLRVAGNPALHWSRERHQGRVLGFFCFDHVFLSRPDFSVNRFQFFLETVAALHEELRAAGGDLLVRDVGPKVAFAELRAQLRHLPDTVSWNRDYEPFATARDQAMEKVFVDEWGVAVHTERDHLLIEPHEILKSADPAKPYQVFTPFSKKWREVYRTPQVNARVEAQRAGLAHLKKVAAGKRRQVFEATWKPFLKKALPDVLEAYRERNRRQVTVPIPPAGSAAVWKALQQFRDRVRDYGRQRDYPAIPGTSHFSVYLKNGSTTVAQAIAALDLDDAPGTKSGPGVFVNELVWREFYYYILAKFPHVETQAFRPQYQGLEWENSKKHFAAWRDGLTGYPIVDAGMRQLRETGWMHNRVRMIVASFLTKDLLIDYRWGERYFMNALLDGDLAPNNGGWQWAASTGCDPQPYFRIFNPKLQSEKFDAEGEYIRRWVPELRGVKGRAIHQPEGKAKGYPRPIVEHGEAREKALALFRGIRGRDS